MPGSRNSDEPLMTFSQGRVAVSVVSQPPRCPENQGVSVGPFPQIQSTQNRRAEGVRHSRYCSLRTLCTQDLVGQTDLERTYGWDYSPSVKQE